MLLQQLRHAAGVGAIHEARRHAHDANRRRQRARQAHRQVVQRRLARAIGNVAADGCAPGDGADVDHQAGAARRQQGAQGAHGSDGAADVDAKDAVDQLVCQRVQIRGGDGLRNAGVVDEDIEPAVAPFDFAREGGLGGAVLYRCAVGEMAISASARQLPRQPLGRTLAARIGERAARPGRREAARDGRADAARAAGDEGRFSGECL